MVVTLGLEIRRQKGRITMKVVPIFDAARAKSHKSHPIQLGTRCATALCSKLSIFGEYTNKDTHGTTRVV